MRITEGELSSGGRLHALTVECEGQAIIESMHPLLNMHLPLCCFK
jgi:hypothetical protein